MGQSSSSIPKGNIMLERLLNTLCAIVGAIMFYVSLKHAAGYVGIVWIVGLVVGSQLIVMAIRSAVKS